MEPLTPLTLITWVGAISLSIVMAAIALYTVYVIVQNIRGKSVTKTKPSTTVIQNGRTQ